MDSLCVFKLSQNKYYVDKISKSVIPDIIEISSINILYNIWEQLHNPDINLNKKNYLELKNIKWLNTYYFLGVEELRDFKESDDLDIITLNYMKKYGLDNVRGGSFQNDIFDEKELKFLKTIIEL
jgi:hypothetical protein